MDDVVIVAAGRTAVGKLSKAELRNEERQKAAGAGGHAA